jgi:hypothetical protein
LGIYGSILSANRELAKPENLEKLREMAEDEFIIRNDLIKKAIEEEKELRRQESALLIEQRHLENIERVARINKGKRTALKFFSILLVFSILAWTAFFLLNKHKDGVVAKDCLKLQKFNDASKDSQYKSLINIANLSFVIKSYPNSSSFDFMAASQFMDKNLLNLVPVSYESPEIRNFVKNSKINARNINELLKNVEPKKLISSLKTGKESLFNLAVTQAALFDANGCREAGFEQGLLISELPINAKLRMGFISNFMVKALPAKESAVSTSKPKSKLPSASKPKPEIEASPSPTFVSASAYQYMQRFMAQGIDCISKQPQRKIDEGATCYSSDIWVNNHGANSFSAFTSKSYVNQSCTQSSPILPNLARNVAYFKTSEAYFVIAANKGDRVWLNNAAQIIMNTFGALFCG